MVLYRPCATEFIMHCGKCLSINFYIMRTNVMHRRGEGMTEREREREGWGWEGKEASVVNG